MEGTLSRQAGWLVDITEPGWPDRPVWQWSHDGSPIAYVAERGGVAWGPAEVDHVHAPSPAASDLALQWVAAPDSAPEVWVQVPGALGAGMVRFAAAIDTRPTVCTATGPRGPQRFRPW